ncbi:hypothetical protein PSTT_05562 [Puccinia striiformis]|uniref:Uncharacterized protein n=1 Tax=Puccinia striiformis TaxID=27350 RepID=A0A2S4VNQ7_9BASI|nr:hypothetical protein PSTT_05562 [Puccinia striiformis]
MKVEKWEEALQNANLLPEYEDVLRGYVKSFDQGIPHHKVGYKTKYYTPANHSSALQVREKITESIKKEIAAGRIFGPFTRRQVNQHCEFFRTSPLGAVINGDGTLRPINDLSYPHSNSEIPSLNSFVDSDNFKTTWDDFNIVAKFLRGTILIKEQINIVAKRVVSKENRADALSQGDRGGHDAQDQVAITVPEDLTGLIQQV